MMYRSPQNWFLFLTATAVVLALLVLSLQFRNQQRQILNRYTDFVQRQQATIDTYLSRIEDQIQHLRLVAEQGLSSPLTTVRESPLLSYIQPSPNWPGYALNKSAMPTEWSDRIGSFGGEGEAAFSDPEWRAEVSAALNLSPHLRQLHQELPAAAWSYYLSNRRFGYLYPEAPEPLLNNPISAMRHNLSQSRWAALSCQQSPIWSPPYQDPSGRGELLTLQAPVCRNDRALGSINIDIQVSALGQLLQELQPLWGELALLHPGGEVLAPATKANQPWLEPELQLTAIPVNKAFKAAELVFWRASLNHFPADMMLRLSKARLYYLTLQTMILHVLIAILVICLAITIWRQQRFQYQLIELAQTDSLTHIANRAALLEALDQAIAGGRREDTKLALLFIDLDEFKRVNDQLGHAIGDQVLCELAHRLQEQLRPGDMVARLGGDEFVVLARGAGAEDISQICSRLRAAVGNSFSAQGVPWPLQVSIGVALYPEDGTDTSSLLSSADRAMYRDKYQSSRTRPAQHPPS